jgi:GH18 family chitinase
MAPLTDDFREYPVAEERSGRTADYDNYTTFLANLKRALASSGHSYGLSITIPSSYWYMQHFDLVGIAKSIDWFNVMSYDLHGTWDASSKWVGAIVGSHTNLTEIDNALDLLWRNNINPDQVVIGLGLYGRSMLLFTMNHRNLLILSTQASLFPTLLAPRPVALFHLVVRRELALEMRAHFRTQRF